MENKIPILVVDDEASLRGVLSQVLSADGHEVKTAENGEQALEVLRGKPYPLVISDIKMPGISGIELLQEIKKTNPQTEVIIMTSHASLDSAVTALRYGAYDYLVKPFEDIDIVSSVAHRAIEKIQLETQNRKLVSKLKKQNTDLENANKVLKELAIRDGLTALYNHRYFQEALAMELLRARRYSHQFSIIFLDVDDFKQYNDVHGHPAGDQLLRILAQNLSVRLRKSDLIARYGGEEFVALLPETSKEVAIQVAEGMRHFVAHHPFKGRDTQPGGKVTVSIGVATFPIDGKDGSSLLKSADQGLYKAKHSGKNQVC